MAISTNTFTINANYTKADMINQLEDAFTWLGWHDKCDHTGLVTGCVDYGMYQDDTPSGGDPQAYAYYYSAEQTSTTGVGTGASFYSEDTMVHLMQYMLISLELDILLEIVVWLDSVVLISY